MPGINQLPAGSEFAAAISLVWVSCSEVCAGLLLWLAWTHEEGWSYLALLSISALVSNTASIIQQGHDVTWYTDIVTEQYIRKQKLPGTDPELAIAGGSYGLDLVLYYIQYYNYNVQAMLVMFWAGELCQLTYQVGEQRKIRRVLRKAHVAGKFVSWLLPLVTILLLRIPGLKEKFVAFILIADLPLMLSLAIGSGLMIAVTIRYVQSRQKFTQWSPPKFNSSSTSEGGTMNSGTYNSSTPTHTTSSRRGLYDRWLMVRFTIAFILLAVFEVTNTLFQVTALNNNIHDAKASAPDLSAGRATETMFLFMPGTTPGIFMYVVFGTTAASRQKFKEKFFPKSWRQAGPGTAVTPPSWIHVMLTFCGCCFGRHANDNNNNNKKNNNNNSNSNNNNDNKMLSQTNSSLDHDSSQSREGGIHVERSLTITSASRTRHASQAYHDDVLDYYDDDDDDHHPAVSSTPIEISMSDLPSKRPVDSAARPVHISSYMKPLPTPPPLSKFSTTVYSGGHVGGGGGGEGRGGPLASNPFQNPKTNNNNNNHNNHNINNTGHRLGLSAIEEKSSVGGASNSSAKSARPFDQDAMIMMMTRTSSGESLRVPGASDEDDDDIDDYHGGHLNAEHSDDSGPILPIQRPEVRFAPNIYDKDSNTTLSGGGGGGGGRYQEGTGMKPMSRRDRLSKNFSRPGR